MTSRVEKSRKTLIVCGHTRSSKQDKEQKYCDMLNNVQNVLVLHLCHAHMRKDTRLSSASILERGKLQMRVDMYLGMRLHDSHAHIPRAGVPGNDIQSRGAWE